MVKNLPTVHDFNKHFAAFFAALPDRALSATDFDGHTTDASLNIDRTETIAHSGDRGLYYLTDVDGGILYVGVATQAFGTRFWDHYGKVHFGSASSPLKKSLDGLG